MSSIKLYEGSPQATPVSGVIVIYAKTDGTIAYKDGSGQEHVLDISTTISAINNDADHGSTAPHNYASTPADVGLGNVENVALSTITWSEMGISTSDVTASDVGLGNLTNHQQARSPDGYEIQKNGAGGSGVINFIT